MAKTSMKLLITPDYYKMLVKDPNTDYHSKYGVLKKEVMLSAKDGDVVDTNMGRHYAIMTPAFIDLYQKMKRGPQVIPPKDIGRIITETGMNKGSVVVDAGAGSGGSCLFFAHVCKKVYAFEMRDDHFAIVENNIKFLGLKNVVLQKQDISQNIPVKNADIVNLDVAEPWLCIETAKKALKVGGFIVSYSPCIPQVSDFVEKMLTIDGLVYIKTLELIERTWDVEGRKLRPQTMQSINHSGFLTFVRKVKK